MDLTNLHSYQVADGHADILSRMAGERLNFWNPDSGLQMTDWDQQQAGIRLQAFAIFPEPRHSSPTQLRHILQSIDLYRQQILSRNIFMPIDTKSDLQKLQTSSLRGGILTLEGAHGLCEDIGILRTLFCLGVRSIGFTWNYQNSLATGIREPKDTGLTRFGCECLEEMQRLGMVVDVAHLSRKSVYQTLELATTPIICSHGNAYDVYPHVRNLPNDQIQSIAKTGGYIGITFVPYFIAKEAKVNISSLLRHIDHLLSLVGENHIAIGSDFDGIDETMCDLQRGANIPLLLEALEKEYGRRVTEQIAWNNMNRVWMQILPISDKLPVSQPNWKRE